MNLKTITAALGATALAATATACGASTPNTAPATHPSHTSPPSVTTASERSARDIVVGDGYVPIPNGALDAMGASMPPKLAPYISDYAAGVKQVQGKARIEFVAILTPEGTTVMALSAPPEGMTIEGNILRYHE